MTLAQSTGMGTEAELLIGPPDDPDRYVLDRRISVDRDASTWHGLLRIEELAVEVRARITHPEAGPYLERDGTIRRWRWQAELVNSLDHPALERVRDIFVGMAPRHRGDPGEGRSLALVTNWIGGRRLDARVGARSGSDGAALVPVLRQIADVVDRLHRGVGGQPIVHRTLSPSSITVDRGRVHLEGLGSARPASPSLGAVPGVAATWTPPEVLKGRPYGPAGDRWCVGALAHVLITGAPPPLLSPAETVDALLAAPVLRGDPALVGHILRLLTPEPKLRPRALLPWVDELAEMLAAPASAPAAPPPAPLDIAFPGSDAESTAPRAGARALTDLSAADPKTSLLLEWDPDSLAPLLPCVRESMAPPRREPSLARRLLPFAAAGATILAIASVVVDRTSSGGSTAPEPAAAVAGAPDPSSPGAPPADQGAADGAPAQAPATTVAPAPMALDSFDEEGRSGLDGGTLDWEVAAGEWSVSEGVARPVAADGAGVTIATVDLGEAPSAISARLDGIVPGSGINVRVVDGSTYWAFVHLPAPTGDWQIIRVSPEGVESVGTFEGPSVETATLSLRIDGSELVALVDGTELGRIDDDRELDATAVGIGSAATGIGAVTYDNVRVTAG